jgi:hypothetical protein
MNSIKFMVFAFCLFCANACESKNLPSESEIEQKASLPVAEAAPLLSFFKTPDQQLLPLGFLALTEDMKKPEILARLRTHRINLVHKYHSLQTLDDARLDLAAATTAGIGVLQNLPAKHLTSESTAFWDHHISQLAAERQFRIWYLPEETKEQDIPRLRQVAQIIRKTDADRRPIITYLEDSRCEYLRQFTDIVDAIVFGAYPTMTPWRPRADIKCRLERAQECGQRPVFAALEAIQYKGKWTRPKDVRFDAYLSLTCGAQGLLWYSYNQARQNTELLEAIFAFAEEVNGPSHLGEALLAGTPITSLAGRVISGPSMAPPASAYENRSSAKTVPYPSLQWTARQWDNHLYLIALNMAQTVGADDDGGEAASIRARFDRFPTADEVEVLFENRTIRLREGSFEDHFLPLEVHIYRTKL